MTQVTGTERDNSLYRKDSFIQTWTDRRYVATLIKWMELQGLQPRYMSEVLNTAIISLVEALVSQDRVDRVQFTQEADKIIERTIKTSLNPSGRGKKNYTHNLELDDLRLEALGKTPRNETPASDLQQRHESDFDKQIMREAHKLLRGEEENK